MIIPANFCYTYYKQGPEPKTETEQVFFWFRDKFSLIKAILLYYVQYVLCGVMGVCFDKYVSMLKVKTENRNWTEKKNIFIPSLTQKSLYWRCCDENIIEPRGHNHDGPF
jgi:hypothetical protein